MTRVRIDVTQDGTHVVSRWSVVRNGRVAIGNYCEYGNGTGMSGSSGARRKLTKEECRLYDRVVALLHRARKAVDRMEVSINPKLHDGPQRMFVGSGNTGIQG